MGCHVVLRVQALAERAQHPNQKCQPKLRVSGGSGVLAWVSEVFSAWQASHLQVAAASLVASARCSRPALVAAWRNPKNDGRRLALLLHRRRRGERPIQPPAQLLSWASHLSNKSVVRKTCALEVVGMCVGGFVRRVVLEGVLVCVARCEYACWRLYVLVCLRVSVC